MSSAENFTQSAKRLGKTEPCSLKRFPVVMWIADIDLKAFSYFVIRQHNLQYPLIL